MKKTAEKHFLKIKRGIAGARHRFGWKWKFGVAAASAILAIGAIWWLALPLPQNYETEIPRRAKSHSAEITACDYRPETGAIIEIKFLADQPAQIPYPEYRVEEAAAEGRTRVIFENVSRLADGFDWQQIAANPLIDAVKWEIADSRLILEISRKGPYSPARIETQGVFAKVILPAAEKNHPAISGQKPAPDSFAFPMRHTVSFEAVLAAPLKNATIFVNEQAIPFRQEPIGPGKYLFSFEQEVETEKEYAVRAIIADEENRIFVGVWNFIGQVPGAAILGKDRFKYLGWWGQINTNGVSVRQSPAANSEKLGALSTANRVKVIEEVFGQPVDGKSLWYRIDGGMYAGAYIFSDFVTPMTQPEPPAEFIIPEGVRAGEKWLDVDLSKKIMVLFDYDKPVFATYISPGREENPTKPGVYRIWYKLVKDDMQGGPPLHSYRYHLKDIPWVMYYNYDYAIHGTYWHDRFGMPQSAGCTNMTQGDAKFIFENTLPELPEGQGEIFAREKPNVGYGTGTVVYNHD